MSATRLVLSAVLLAYLPVAAPAQPKKGADELTLVAAVGAVEKADGDALVVQPRGPGGKFQKAVTLKLTGTSKVTVLAPQKRGDKVVLTQKEGAAKDLVAGQVVAVVYADGGADGPVLLSAVAQPPAGK